MATNNFTHVSQPPNSVVAIPELVSLIIYFAANSQLRQGWMSQRCVTKPLFSPSVGCRAFSINALIPSSISSFALVSKCWNEETLRLRRSEKTIEGCGSVEVMAGRLRELTTPEAIQHLTVLTPDMPGFMCLTSPCLQSQLRPAMMEILPKMTNLRVLDTSQIILFEEIFSKGLVGNFPHLHTLLIQFPQGKGSSGFPSHQETNPDFLLTLSTLPRLRNLSIIGQFPPGSRPLKRPDIPAPNFEALELSPFAENWDWLLSGPCTTLRSLAIHSMRPTSASINVGAGGETENTQVPVLDNICEALFRSRLTLRTLLLGADINSIASIVAASCLTELEHAVLHNVPVMGMAPIKINDGHYDKGYEYGCDCFFRTFVSKKLEAVHFGAGESFTVNGRRLGVGNRVGNGSPGPSIDAIKGFIFERSKSTMDRSGDEPLQQLKVLSVYFPGERWGKDGEGSLLMQRHCKERGIHFAHSKRFG